MFILVLEISLNLLINSYTSPSVFNYVDNCLLRVNETFQYEVYFFIFHAYIYIYLYDILSVFPVSSVIQVDSIHFGEGKCL